MRHKRRKHLNKAINMLKIGKNNGFKVLLHGVRSVVYLSGNPCRNLFLAGNIPRSSSVKTPIQKKKSFPHAGFSAVVCLGGAPQ